MVVVTLIEVMVILNLVLNAIKAMPDGEGVLTLRARSGKSKVIVEVEEFGLTERRTMQLQTRRLGGTP